jgi:preprotein translocase subunit SecD
LAQPYVPQQYRDNIGQPMAVVFIEQKSTTHIVNGKKVRRKEQVKEVISIATVRDAFSNIVCPLIK